MSNPDGAREGMLKWLEDQDPERQLVVMMPLPAVALMYAELHGTLDVYERMGADEQLSALTAEALRAFERTLVQAGYSPPREPA